MSTRFDWLAFRFSNDHDSDGCIDASEDNDDDNDGVLDSDEVHLIGNLIKIQTEMAMAAEILLKISMMIMTGYRMEVIYVIKGKLIGILVHLPIMIQMDARMIQKI